MLIYTKNIVIWEKREYSFHILNGKEKEYGEQRINRGVLERTGFNRRRN